MDCLIRQPGDENTSLLLYSDAAKRRRYSDLAASKIDGNLLKGILDDVDARRFIDEVAKQGGASLPAVGFPLVVDLNNDGEPQAAPVLLFYLERHKDGWALSPENPQVNRTAIERLLSWDRYNNRKQKCPAPGVVDAEIRRLNRELRLDEANAAEKTLSDYVTLIAEASPYWFEKKLLDPAALSRIDVEAVKNGGNQTRVTNSAVLFSLSIGQYHVHLKNDLDDLLKLKGEDLNNTALKHFLADEPLLCHRPRRVPVFPVKDLNGEQELAVRTAMDSRNPLLVIQGPPGTGKSQLVAALIANAVSAGQRLLLTSQNNAAISAVSKKLEVLQERNEKGEACGWAFLDLSKKKEAGTDGRSEQASPVTVLDRILKQQRNLGEYQVRYRQKVRIERKLIVARIALRTIRGVLRLLAFSKSDRERGGRLWNRVRSASRRTEENLHGFYLHLGEEWLAALTKAGPEAFRAEKGRTQVLKCSNSLKASPGNLDAFTRFFSDGLNGVFGAMGISMLSLRKFLPLSPALFDIAIVDEAGQCHLLAYLPLLFRAKRVVVIGDDQQLEPIVSMGGRQDSQLLDKHALLGTHPHWAYGSQSILSSAISTKKEDVWLSRANAKETGGTSGDSKRLWLRSHYRCHPDIIGYSNKEFYQGNLRVCTDTLSLNVPPGGAMQWVDVPGKVVRSLDGSYENEIEVERIVKVVSELVEFCKSRNLDPKRGKPIGVITPFRQQKAALSRALSRRADWVKVDTVHGFQGDECELIVLSTVLSKGATASAASFVNENRKLINVAVTRAKSGLIVVGDAAYARRGDSSLLFGLLNYIENPHRSNDTPRLPVTSVPYDSKDERLFADALQQAGIRFVPHLRVSRYEADFAIFSSDSKDKLDVEVDGGGPHSDSTLRDHERDETMKQLGWDVRRFSSDQIRGHLEECVDVVREWVARHESVTVE